MLNGRGCDLYFYQNLKFFEIRISHVYYIISHTCHKNVSVYFNLILSQGRKCCGVGEPGAWCSYVTRAAKDPSDFTITGKALLGRDFSRLKAPTSAFTI